MVCAYLACGRVLTESLGPRPKKFCNKSCKNNHYVTENRRKQKLRVIEALGGACVRCGWKEHPAGLHPHHTDPTTKGFALGNGATVSWARIEVEVKKCVLLCANCHAVVHATNDSEYLCQQAH